MDDGVPRYIMCGTESLRKMCAGHESFRDGASLTLRPDPACPWYYMNFSFVAQGGNPKEGNVANERTFLDERLRSGVNVQEILSIPGNGCVLRPMTTVKKGEELFFGYPYASDGHAICGSDHESED